MIGWNTRVLTFHLCDCRQNDFVRSNPRTRTTPGRRRSCLLEFFIISSTHICDGKQSLDIYQMRVQYPTVSKRSITPMVAKNAEKAIKNAPISAGIVNMAQILRRTLLVRQHSKSGKYNEMKSKNEERRQVGHWHHSQGNTLAWVLSDQGYNVVQ